MVNGVMGGGTRSLSREMTRKLRSDESVQIPCDQFVDLGAID